MSGSSPPPFPTWWWWWGGQWGMETAASLLHHPQKALPTSSVAFSRKEKRDREGERTEASCVSSVGPERPSQAALIPPPPQNNPFTALARPRGSSLQLFMAECCAGFRRDAAASSRNAVKQSEGQAGGGGQETGGRASQQWQQTGKEKGRKSLSTPQI